MHLHSLLLLVLDLEYVVLVVLSTGSPHKYFVIGCGGFGLADFGENKGFSRLFSRVVDGIDHLL